MNKQESIEFLNQIKESFINCSEQEEQEIIREINELSDKYAAEDATQHSKFDLVNIDMPEKGEIRQGIYQMETQGKYHDLELHKQNYHSKTCVEVA